MFEANSTIGWAIARLTTTASDLMAFIRAPRLDPAGDLSRPGTTGLPWLFAVNILIILALAAVLFPIMLALDVTMSNSMAAIFDRPVWQLLLIVVVAGPIVEELIFRSWLSGSPRMLALFGAFALWAGGTYLAGRMGWLDGQSSAPLLLMAGGFLVAIVALAFSWKRPVPGWFVRFFPMIFWTQAILFGFIHVFNYAGDNPAIMLPFVLPQLVGGLVWGYARIRHGWWANILMHMAYNLLAISGLLYMILTRTAAG